MSHRSPQGLVRIANPSGGQDERNFGPEWSATWLYNLRLASSRHGSEEPGEVQDIRLVVDTIPTLAWSAGPDGSADFFNQRRLDYTGLSAEQTLDSGWQGAIHPDDRPRILETFREALNSVGPYEVEGRFAISLSGGWADAVASADVGTIYGAHQRQSRFHRIPSPLRRKPHARVQLRARIVELPCFVVRI
jgi:PAS domain-containing protein